ncbi:MAG: EF-P beta-lysylation protein EpmB [Pseudomonadales bacterium]|nr:EF-P beta-lysylation protein EpmB [Pseudomonadales bacterium]
MIPRIDDSIEESSWKKILSSAIKSPLELLQRLELPENLLLSGEVIDAEFAQRVPEPFLNRIKKGDINDPLLKQVLPVAKEREQHQNYIDDPLQESDSNPIPGVLHKYKSRALLITHPACPIHCRYCFRRHFPYGENNPGQARRDAALAYIRQDAQLNEVILSGGDPLTLYDPHLQSLFDQISGIPHIKRIRLHSRFPVVIPQRITDTLIRTLQQSPLKTVLVLHINHPQEIDQQVANVLQRLQHNNITLLNQSVLLHGINDDATILKHLSEKLFDIGVLPYYLHLPDAVAGTAHFDVSKARAIGLMRELQAELPGFLVPKLVKENPGEHAKTTIFGG